MREHPVVTPLGDPYTASRSVSPGVPGSTWGVPLCAVVDAALFSRCRLLLPCIALQKRTTCFWLASLCYDGAPGRVPAHCG